MADQGARLAHDRPRRVQVGPDRSRDPRIEDLSNLYLIHPVARALLPVMVRVGVPANAVSVAGLVLGAVAAACFAWRDSAWLAALGFIFSVGWLVADGLDGMVARVTGTASASGRLLDGLCDHGVFVLLYAALATSVGTFAGWALAIAAGFAHVVQSSLYEGERARFHRRAKGIANPRLPALSGPAIVRAYDRLATSIDRLASGFERRMASDADPASFGRAYADAAAPFLRWMTLLSANVRIGVLFIASLAGNPALFWIFEMTVLSLVLAVTLLAHRAVERRYAALPLALAHPSAASLADVTTKE